MPSQRTAKFKKGDWLRVGKMTEDYGSFVRMFSGHVGECVAVAENGMLPSSEPTIEYGLVFHDMKTVPFGDFPARNMCAFIAEEVLSLQDIAQTAKKERADKTRISIAIEPCGEFCNDDDHECPFLKGIPPTSDHLWKDHCNIFGEIGLMNNNGKAKRHPACIEAQKQYEERRTP